MKSLSQISPELIIHLPGCKNSKGDGKNWIFGKDFKKCSVVSLAIRVHFSPSRPGIVTEHLGPLFLDSGYRAWLMNHCCVVTDTSFDVDKGPGFRSVSRLMSVSFSLFPSPSLSWSRPPPQYIRSSVPVSISVYPEERESLRQTKATENVPVSGPQSDQNVKTPAFLLE